MESKTYEVWFSPLSDGGIRVNARLMLRHYDPENGHYWAEKTVKMPFDHEGDNHQKIIRMAWPDASSIQWIGDSERGSLWYATS
jgi:hypothetical protein